MLFWLVFIGTLNKRCIMKKLILTTVIVFLYGCATVDGMRTDMGNGVGVVADWIKPSQPTKK